MLPALAGSNILYGMGLLEMGITFSYAQLLVDQEFVRMVRRIMQGITVNQATLAVEVINAVGAGGNYLTQQHTLDYMRQEQSRAKLIDRRTRDGWLGMGGKEMIERAHEEALAILENYTPQPLDIKVAERLEEIVQEAEQEVFAEKA